MHPVKVELEDRAFAVLEPEAWHELRRDMATLVPERERTIDQVVTELASALDAAGIGARFEARVKGSWSVQRKLRVRGVDLDELWDLVGIRIIVADRDACYAALGIVTSLYDQVPGRFKDYVDRPRFGVYQSLHVTCVTANGTRFEVQIRDEEMHTQATRGVGAHWAYKDAGDPRRLRAEIGWMRDLAEAVAASEASQSWGPDAGDAVASGDTTIVLTPQGEPVALPPGATPVDFAYAVHTGLGDRTQGARVNDKLVSLDTPLERGDVVEILARPRSGDPQPSADWLNFVVSRKARTRIRRHVRRLRNAEAAERGMAALASALSGPGSRQALDQLGNWARRHGYAGEAAVQVAIGSGRLDAATVAEDLRDPDAAAARDATPPPPPQPVTPSRADASVENLRVVGAPWLEVRTTAQCCELATNGPVVGYLGKRGTVTAHAASCVNVADLRRRAEAGEGAMVELTWS
ncbi:MAG: TGS domain-containing protein [Actinomycetota bacterium]|nr:TGS domain-containing protein [Actinomycetota bacterium]